MMWRGADCPGCTSNLKVRKTGNGGQEKDEATKEMCIRDRGSILASAILEKL